MNTKLSVVTALVVSLFVPFIAFAQVQTSSTTGGPLFDDGHGDDYGGGKVTLCYQESTRSVSAREAARLFKLGATTGPCTPHGTLVITKTTIGGDGTFKFWTHNGNLADFNVKTASSTGTRIISLAHGSYDINEYTQRGWTLVSNSCANITITSGATTTCTVTNQAAPATISGTVFADLNGNGKGFRNFLNRRAGVTVYLDTNNNGLFDLGEPTIVTNLVGNYSFLNLPANTTYHVREVPPVGTTETYPTSKVYNETPNAGQNITGDDFANYTPSRGHHWYDDYIQGRDRDN